MAHAEPRFRIESLNSLRGMTGRSMILLPAGLCIVLHYPPSAETLENGETPVRTDPRAVEVKTSELVVFDSYWQKKLQDASADQSQFNCVTFALGNSIGLGIHDWVEPMARVETAYSIPAQVILDSFYKPVATYDAQTADWGSIESDPALQDDDVFCYVSSQSDPRMFVHMGVLETWQGNRVLISKFGCGAIMRTSLQVAGEVYAGHFDRLTVYRRSER